MKTEPLLSIVMPTHNRPQYAGPALKAALSHNDMDIEVIVSDTSDNDHLVQYLRDNPQIKADPRLVFDTVSGPSSLTKNHNYAMSRATGKYVCLIGDDDGITAATILGARWADDNNVDILSHSISANYAWPDFRAKLARAGHAARLYLPNKLGAPKWRDAKSDLKAGLARAFQGTEHMPRCYHGIVRRELMENIRHKTGDYFHGSSPDMSGAVCLATMANTYVEVDYPLSLPGASAGSNSGRSAMNTHKGSLNSDNQTRDFAQSGWSDGVPRFFSVETVWAHAGLQSLHMIMPAAVADFNYPRLIAHCYIQHPEFRENIDAAKLEARQILSVSMDQLDALITQEAGKIRRARYRHLLRRAMWPTAAGGRRYVGGLESIVDASAALNETIANKLPSFAEYMADLPAPT